MELKVCYPNPNPNGPVFVILDDVISWKSDHAELHIQRESGRTVFRQWIWAEETQTLDAKMNNSGLATQYQPHLKQKRKSDLSDLALPDAYSVEQAQAASVQFAIDNRTIPWSEAHMKAVLDYEKAVSAQYGPAAVSELPWNQVPRGEDAKRRM